MRKHAFLLVFPVLILFSFLAKGQSQIPKNADAIKLNIDLPDSLLYRAVAEFLLDDGFVLDKESPARKTLTTEPRFVKGLLNVRLIIQAKNGSITFRGEGSGQAMGFKINEPAAYKGPASGVNKASFNYMDAAVKKFAGGVPAASIEYLTTN